MKNSCVRCGTSITKASETVGVPDPPPLTSGAIALARTTDLGFKGCNE